MKSKLKLVVNNRFHKKEKFFIKKELQSILDLYARKVSSGDWKDYGLSINKKEITFDIYQRASETPIYRISKNLNPNKKTEKFYILDKAGKIIKKSENLDNLINRIEWTKLKLVRYPIYLLWPKSLKSIINRFIKSRYKVKAPITAFFPKISLSSLARYIFLIF